MPGFDPHMVRDGQYSQQLQVLKDKILAVQAADTFIAYASHRDLLQALQDTYQENLQHYENDYQANTQGAGHDRADPGAGRFVRPAPVA